MRFCMNGYVLVHPIAREGLGSRLLQLGQSAWLARRLGRALIVDWRGTVYLKDKSLNYFTEVFAPVSEILGVPMEYAPSPATSAFELAPKRELLKLKQDVLARIGADPGSAPPYLIAHKNSLALRKVPGYDPASFES